MFIADEIRAAVEDRRKLAAWSRDTGIARHGDLTQKDRQISRLIDAYHDQIEARLKAERGGRER